ncbi:MAG: nucleotidyltransferase domain-containing protein [Nanoarchaeota archaeon]|nr:nucleotidyltransferase domain-containing protein [Nanoarchaeota archaeon]
MYIKRYRGLEIIKLYSADYTKQFYLREISRVAHIPLKTTQNLIAYLERDKILKSTIRGKNKYFSLNLDNIQTKFYLLQSEIKRTMDFLEKYPIFKTFLKELKTNFLIIIFGSFAKMKPDKDSDLDILTTTKQLPLHLLPYKIHKIEISESTVKKAVKKQEDLIKEIADNHIILNNHSLYLDIMWGHYAKSET